MGPEHQKYVLRKLWKNLDEFEKIWKKLNKIGKICKNMKKWKNSQSLPKVYNTVAPRTDVACGTRMIRKKCHFDFRKQ